jgi:hypothetical protein
MAGRKLQKPSPAIFNLGKKLLRGPAAALYV